MAKKNGAVHKLDFANSLARTAEAADYLRLLFIEAASWDHDDRVGLVNSLRQVIFDNSPFNDEPVDFVKWVPAENVHANDYNPNSVAPPEMELLRLSVEADGFTQPIVTNLEDGLHEVIDGFHRNRVGKECKGITKRLHGYLPIVQIKGTQADRPDRMASTIRHNRARGKHRIEAMSDIVLELKRRNWSNEKIGKQLGMDPDEVLRLAQITGLAEMFSDRSFSVAWEPTGHVSDDDLATLTLENLDDESLVDQPAQISDATGEDLSSL